MVNTVGSYENKHWQKKWIPIKQSLTLTSDQRTIIIGSLLGDGTMRIGRNAKNANFKVDHGLAQKEYVEWKYAALKKFVFTEPKISYRYDENGDKYAKSWWFRTIRHPALTGIYKKFYTGEGYRNGKKIIPDDIASDINPLAIAVWIMDDGSYSRKKIDISTYSFSLPDIILLKELLKKKFNVGANHYKDREKGCRIYFSQEETKNLIQIIYPYIIPSMMYKIGFRNPVTTESLRSHRKVKIASFKML